MDIVKYEKVKFWDIMDFTGISILPRKKRDFIKNKKILNRKKICDNYKISRNI